MWTITFQQFHQTIYRLTICHHHNYVQVVVDEMLMEFGAKTFCIAARMKTSSVRTRVTTKETESREDRIA
jgi:hypothetical protein